MSQEIVIEGSPQEIARRIAQFPGQILRAVLVVNEPVATQSPANDEDAWTQDFRRWAAAQPKVNGPVDMSRETLYEDRLA